MDYVYDSIGQLKTAKGKESGGSDRLHEKLGYNYDAAGNLQHRTNNALIQTFNVNTLNELSTISRTGTMTVAGTTTESATSVTVNTLTATLFADATFAKDGFTLADGNNTFTAIAQDAYGRRDTNVSISYLPATSSFVYDLNGNLRTNGTRTFDYDDENQLIRITESNAWKAEFSYDGKMRRRTETNYTWQASAWVVTNVTRFVYDGNVPIQHRDENNLPIQTLTRGTDLSGTFQGAGGIGGLLALTANSELLSSSSYLPASSFYHSDGNGNVTALIAANQLLVARYIYDPYGNTLSISGPKADINRYRFSSKPIHDLAGMYDYLYRWYSPNLQRWLNRDPLGDAALQRFMGLFFVPSLTAKTELTLYPFVRNNPLSRFDPLGLSEGIWGIPGTGGGCHNTSSGNEWGLVAGRWVLIPPGGSTGWGPDCDGMTCGGGFYYISDLSSGSCDTPGHDDATFCNRRWTPTNPRPDARPPGGPGGRGSSQGNTPPGYVYSN